jgi:hypothetical protein
VGLTTLPCKKEIVEKPPRNLAGFCGGGQGLSWAVEPRKERIYNNILTFLRNDASKTYLKQNICSIILRNIFINKNTSLIGSHGNQSCPLAP